MAEVRFCPQCGAQVIPPANFCATCGAPLPGYRQSVSSPQTKSSPPVATRALTPGLLVLTFYLLIGLGLWLFVLRTQPFPTASSPGAGGQASMGGSTLPQNHPDVALPEEAKKILAD